MRGALAIAAALSAPACYQGSIEPEGDPIFEVDSKYGGFTIYRDGADLELRESGPERQKHAGTLTSVSVNDLDTMLEDLVPLAETDFPACQSDGAVAKVFLYIDGPEEDPTEVEYCLEDDETPEQLLPITQWFSEVSSAMTFCEMSVRIDVDDC